jgi:hypothetical protein
MTRLFHVDALREMLEMRRIVQGVEEVFGFSWIKQSTVSAFDQCCKLVNTLLFSTGNPRRILSSFSLFFVVNVTWSIGRVN